MTESALSETRQRQCPVCQSQRIVPAGHLVATWALIKEEHRCTACRTAFFLVRPAFT